MSEFSFISPKLLDWFDKNKRELPWRMTQDPYKIWISEIILQQTRVVQGMDYYLRFIQRFPTIQDLAKAEEQEVLKLWQGLGYYSRARNLHHTAQVLLNEYGGKFPEDHKAILSLKGIGDYTAAAITSFAWNMSYPAVDGNVFRFFARLFMIDEPIDTQKGKKLFTDLVRQAMDEKRAGDFNQGTMEFGALQCIPQNPDCSVCPFMEHCLAYKNNSISHFPVKRGKIKTEERYLYYFRIKQGEYTYLIKRSGQGIWKNLFEYPMIESHEPFSFENLTQNKTFKELFSQADLDFRLIIQNKKHVLSHRVLYASLYEVHIPMDFNIIPYYIKIKESEFEDYPVHRLMEYF
jgi:A/G-specific adenine glycosylase